MRAAIAIGLLIATARPAGGQDPSAPPGAAVVTPAFAVASVRPNTSPGPVRYSMRWFPDGRFRATNITARRLIDLAYDLRTDHQLMGRPGWIASERFDVDAVPAVPVAPPQRKLMLQGLLRDRFGLAMRPQPVEVPVYFLVRTRPDEPLPRTIRELTVTCTIVRIDPDILIERGGPLPAGDPRCAGISVDREGGRTISAGTTMNALIAFMSPMVDRRIRDRTGLTGRYDFELTWAPELVFGGDSAIANAGIFMAIQQLGLKLEPGLSPETGYVIERIQRPAN
jgi:uncharacterized protein (TIGR03435 family)